MRVLEVITDTNIGGAGILLETRCRYMDRSKFQITVALPRGAQLTRRLRRMGIPTVEVDGCYDRSWELGSIAAWVHVLRRVKPALVNCHSCLSCRVAARLCRVPVVVDTRHCAFAPRRALTLPVVRGVVGGLLGALSDHTVAVADAAKENLLSMGVPEEKITVIINGARPIPRRSEEERCCIRSSLGIPRDATVVGLFARLEPCKDHPTLLRAARSLLRKNSNCVFLLVGEGSQRNALERMAEALGVSRSVIFTGFSEDVSPYMNITDIQVNCSVGTETSSLALSEGMSLGIPVVASRFGGNPYMVREGENGYLFPMGRSDLLAERIVQIAGNEALYRRLSEGALRRFSEELNAERMTRQTEAAYERWFRERVSATDRSVRADS